MVRWCDSCHCVESTHRVEYSESRAGFGTFASDRWVQNLCEFCATEKVPTLEENPLVWAVEVREF